MVVSLTDAVNLSIKLTTPSGVVVNWRSIGSGGGFHTFAPEPLEARTSPWLPLITSDDPRHNQYPVLDGPMMLRSSSDPIGVDSPDMSGRIGGHVEGCVPGCKHARHGFGSYIETANRKSILTWASYHD